MFSEGKTQTAYSSTPGENPPPTVSQSSAASRVGEISQRPGETINLASEQIKPTTMLIGVTTTGPADIIVTNSIGDIEPTVSTGISDTIYSPTPNTITASGTISESSDINVNLEGSMAQLGTGSTSYPTKTVSINIRSLTYRYIMGIQYES